MIYDTAEDRIRIGDVNPFVPSFGIVAGFASGNKATTMNGSANACAWNIRTDVAAIVCYQVLEEV